MKNVEQLEEELGMVILDKKGLSQKLTEDEFLKESGKRGWHGVDHKNRREYLQKHGYNDDRFLVERTPEELETDKLA